MKTGWKCTDKILLMLDSSLDSSGQETQSSLLLPRGSLAFGSVVVLTGMNHNC